MTGPYIASSPNPVSQRDFMRTLRPYAGGLARLGIGLPAFAFMVRTAAPLVMRTDPDLVLYGRYVQPKRLLAESFTFDFPDLSPAFADLFAKAPSPSAA